MSRPSGPVLASPRQKKNPLVAYLQIPIEYVDMKPDFVVGETACVLFLNLKYHAIRPEYIYTRVKELGSAFELRVLLIETKGVENPSDAIKDLTKAALIYDLSILVSPNEIESAAYIRHLKQSEHASTQSLEAQIAQGFVQQFTDVVSKAPRVSSTDALVLGQQFGTFREVLKNKTSLQGLTGWGEIKSNNFLRAIHASLRPGAMTPAVPAPDQMETEAGEGSENGTAVSGRAQKPDNQTENVESHELLAN